LFERGHRQLPGTAAAVAVAGVGLCWQTNERQRNAKPPVVKFAGIKAE